MKLTVTTAERLGATRTEYEADDELRRVLIEFANYLRSRRGFSPSVLMSIDKA